MKILVASAFEAGSNFAHAINTVKMAEGFAMLGHDVTLACRAPLDGELEKELLDYQYALHTPLRWVQLSPMRNGRVLNPDWDFARQLFLRLLFLRPDFVFTRNYILPWLSSFMGIPTAAESHAHPGTCTKPFNTFIKGASHRKFKALITIAPVLRDNFVATGVPEEKILVLPDAVDLHIFSPPANLPASPFTGDKANVVYTGHLYDYKGIPLLLETARLAPDIQFHLIGGTVNDIGCTHEKITSLGLSNVTVHGHKPRTDLPPYLWHADALLLPPSLNHPSAQWTSPVKLGEYLASGRPVLASDIPALRAWLTEEHVLFVEPDDAQAWSSAIKYALTHRDTTTQLTENGIKLATSWSYSQRAEHILNFCGKPAHSPRKESLTKL